MVDAVGLALGRVVLPELGPGVRANAQLGLGERGAIGPYGEDGAGGEVGGDADDGGRVDATRGHCGGDGGAQHLAPVLGVLEGPVGRQGLTGGGEFTLDDAVRLHVDGGADLLAVADADHHGPAGESAEVDTHDMALRGLGGGVTVTSHPSYGAPRGRSDAAGIVGGLLALTISLSRPGSP